MKKLLSRLKHRFQNPAKHLSSLDAYARWASNYPAEAHNVLMQIEQEHMLALMPDVQGRTILDLACGTGRYGVIMKKAGASTVIGFDNSMAMLRQRAIDIRDAACATTGSIPLPAASVDTVICALALGHLPDISHSFVEISRVLKSGGTLLLSDFHPYQFLSGARRTFNSGGQTYEVEHYVHHISEYVAAGQVNSLQLTEMAEPVYQGNIPVVIVLKFTKY